MATKKPNFDVINLMPSFIIGKNELVTDPSQITQGSNRVVMSALLGEEVTHPVAGVSVHVDDVAKAHILALQSHVAGNQNLLLSSDGLSGVNFEDAFDIVTELFPEAAKAGRFSSRSSIPTFKIKIDASETEKILDIRFQPFREQVRSVVQHYIDLTAANA